MLPARLHMTFVPADPPREGSVLAWHPELGPEELGALGAVGGPVGARLALPVDDDADADDDDHSDRTDDDADTDDHTAGAVAVREVPALRVGLADVLDDLVGLSVADTAASPSARALAVLVRTALEMVARGRLRPAATPAGNDAWAVGPLDDGDRGTLALLAAWLPAELHCAALDVSGGAARVAGAEEAVAAVVAAVGDSLPRTGAAVPITRCEPWAGWAPADVSALRSHLSSLDEDAEVVVGVRLLAPDDDRDSFAVELQLRAASDPGRAVTAAELWEGRSPLPPGAEHDLLLALRRGAGAWPPLAALLEDPRPCGGPVSDDHAVELLGPAAARLAAVGVEVLAPEGLVRGVRARPRAESPPTTPSAPAFDLAGVARLTWRATLDDEPLDDAELALLAAASRPLLRLRDRWVVVDPAVTEKLGREDRLDAAGALAAALGVPVEVGGEMVRVDVEGPLADLADRLRLAGRPTEAPTPPGLRAELRPYQRRGVAWLTDMAGLGLGAVLADDMGLGKTVQLIAMHLATRDRQPRPTLVVCPASLVGNWQRELARFAPGESVLRYHGPARSLEDLDRHDVVVTTYGVARRDGERLATVDWGIVVADEAQQIKNPSSATARALRRIPAATRVALTGTPVENRLSELWALLDWATPGILGSLDSFHRTVAVPVERDGDEEAAERLSRLVAPFVLRRRKDDPSILPELPPRTVTDHPVRLTREQAGLYRAVVDEVLDSVRGADGIERRGRVLKLLTALKQVCNHPAHYLRQDGPLQGRSGKLDALEDLVTSIVDAGDATLVFTQYVAMGELVLARLGQMGIDAEFLHGGVTLPRRTEMVDRFQGGAMPVLVVSLRAGGTGLNLTAATHVVHYDRWWNPAVEDQASDRVWRIGQDRPVQIHRLVAEGTLEERIAEVLAAKKGLADSVVGGGETWITELGDDELAELVRLSAGDQ